MENNKLRSPIQFEVDFRRRNNPISNCKSGRLTFYPPRFFYLSNQGFLSETLVPLGAVTLFESFEEPAEWVHGQPLSLENSLESNLRNSENPAIYQRSSAIPGIRRGVRLHNLKATPEWVISDRADHPCRDRPLQTQGAAQDQHWFSHLKTV